MPDDSYTKPQFVSCHSTGEMFPFSEEILEDAKRAYFVLKTERARMDALLDIISIYRSVGRIDDLLEFCDSVVKDQKMSICKPEILFRMGEACSEVCRYDQALDFYLASAEFDSPSEQVRYCRLTGAAFCCLMKADPLKAQELCKSAIVINPNQWVAWKDLGMSLELLDDTREAANCYARAIKLSNANVIPIVHMRELVKRRADGIRNLSEIRKELMENHGVLV